MLRITLTAGEIVEITHLGETMTFSLADGSPVRNVRLAIDAPAAFEVGRKPRWRRDPATEPAGVRE